MIELSEVTRDWVRALFAEGERAQVERLLRDRCGDSLPLVDTSYVLLAERIRCAVVKLSAGRLAELERHLAQAAVDWRDVLVAAGFGSDTRAHQRIAAQR